MDAARAKIWMFDDREAMEACDVQPIGSGEVVFLDKFHLSFTKGEKFPMEQGLNV